MNFSVWNSKQVLPGRYVIDFKQPGRKLLFFFDKKDLKDRVGK